MNDGGNQAGGWGGRSFAQACVKVCPVGAIKFAAEMHVQEGNESYRVNMRDDKW